MVLGAVTGHLIMSKPCVKQCELSMNKPNKYLNIFKWFLTVLADISNNVFNFNLTLVILLRVELWAYLDISDCV